MRRPWMVVAGAATVLALVGGVTAVRSAEKPPVKAPSVEGAWTGTWGPYVPPKPEGEATAKPASDAGAKKPTAYTRVQMRLDCKITPASNGEYGATFEGECGRPYKYTIKMLGRQAGGSVLFKGTTDLGEQDGGVYDWIGRATEKEFLGFYTSASHTGTFTLTRAK